MSGADSTARGAKCKNICGPDLMSQTLIEADNFTNILQLYPVEST